MDILRDPLWNNVRLDPLALSLMDTSPFQRLRYIRQLGHTYLVYPGATHTRFEHAVGTYHLAGVATRLLSERGDLNELANNEISIIRTAALLHDIGHYPFSHAVEEIGVTSHELVARPLLTSGVLSEILTEHLGADAPRRIHDLMTGTSLSPLQGLISGSLDLDKIEYLRRDGTMCGVPYGEIDVDRLLNSLVLVPAGPGGTLTTGVHEKGVSALESLLFSRYQMYRNVYWHHAVRSATAMYKRLVSVALGAAVIDHKGITDCTDDELMVRLDVPALPTEAQKIRSGLRNRKLYKRAFECSASLLEHDAAEWIAANYALTKAVEDQLARELGLPEGDVLIDYPAKTQMLAVDLPLLRRNGSIERLDDSGWQGAINLPQLSDEFYRTARRLRVYSAERTQLDDRKVIRLARMSADEVRERLQRGDSLL